LTTPFLTIAETFSFDLVSTFDQLPLVRVETDVIRFGSNRRQQHTWTVVFPFFASSIHHNRRNNPKRGLSVVRCHLTFPLPQH
jgi:hypothetical protein